MNIEQTKPVMSTVDLNMKRKILAPRLNTEQLNTDVPSTTESKLFSFLTEPMAKKENHSNVGVNHLQCQKQQAVVLSIMQNDVDFSLSSATDQTENIQSNCSSPENIHSNCSPPENIQSNCSSPENIQSNCSPPENFQSNCSSPENIQSNCSSPELFIEVCSPESMDLDNIDTRSEMVDWILEHKDILLKQAYASDINPSDSVESGSQGSHDTSGSGKSLQGYYVNYLMDFSDTHSDLDEDISNKSGKKTLNNNMDKDIKNLTAENSLHVDKLCPSFPMNSYKPTDMNQDICTTCSFSIQFDKEKSLVPRNRVNRSVSLVDYATDTCIKDKKRSNSTGLTLDTQTHDKFPFLSFLLTTENSLNLAAIR